jgi:hypothetical protein
LTLFSCALLPSILLAAEADGAAGFREHVAPILASRCVRCHQGEAPKGEIDLTTASGVIEGRGDGWVVVRGKPDESLLLEVVSGAKATMPKSGGRLTAAQVAALRAWIATGAPWPDDLVLKENSHDWWSFRPLERPALPDLDAADRTRVRTPVDAFVLAGLRARGLKPSPEADRRPVIRRLSFDLIGLPPTPDEVDAFLADAGPDAYERLVDRLLASPHHGERWGRHWLDVVHYGDTHGYDKDQPRPNAWPYRDYVIRAFNDDRPYTRFVQEQLAGDVLFPGSRDGIEALGFLAAGPWDAIGHVEVPETKIDGQIARLLDRDDMVSSTLNTFNSLTVQCARCHDHKFDPITQEDYYSLQAVFAALDRADRPYDLDPDAQRRRSELAARRLALVAENGRLRRAGEQAAGDRIVTLDRQITQAEAARVAGGAPNPAPHPPDELPALRARREALVRESLGAADRLRLDAVRRELAAIERQIAALPEPRQVYCGTIYEGRGSFRGTGPDGGAPRVIRVLRRGDVRDPQRVVGPGTVPILDGAPSRFELSLGATEGERRAALARWLTDPRHPLTWRSIVNRVWQYHFGRGIVDSPNDFGRMRQQPSHPELLDWLAVEFRDGGQSLKALHRLIVTSATYRQSCADDASSSSADGGNVLLWRMNRRRLEAEEVRDAVLAVAGRLDLRMGGPGYQDFVIEQPQHSPHYQYHLFDPEQPQAHRRSIYRFIVRSQPQPFMTTLDCADPSMSVEKRNESLTALQALALLNNRFMLVMAGHFGERLARGPGDLGARVEQAYRLALGRPPTPEERAAMLDYGQRFGLTNMCRVLLNLNEFLFID